MVGASDDHSQIPHAAQPRAAPARTARRRFRLILWTLSLLLAIEAAGWLGDAAFSFRRKTLEALRLMRVSNQPVAARKYPGWAGPGLLVRAENDPAIPPGFRYEIGGKVIPEAFPDLRQRMLQPDRLEASHRQRVFVVGGSAAFGFPYPASLCFASILQRLCQERLRVVNAAQMGWTSGELVPVVERIADDFEPDVLVILTGNNEWIHWSPERQSRFDRVRLDLLERLAHSRAIAAIEYALLKWSASRSQTEPSDAYIPHAELVGYATALAHPADPRLFDTRRWLAVREKYLQTFRDNLRRMVRTAQKHNVRTVLLTVPFNYRLCPAWKHPQPLSLVGRDADVRPLIEQAAEEISQNHARAALNLLDKAVRIDAYSPVAHYLRGVSLEALDRPAEAEKAYAQCRENMVGNLGARLSINRVIREVAAETGAELIDLRKRFDQYEHRRGRYFNVDLIHDDCHPTPLGHRLIADALRELLCDENQDDR